MERTTIVSLTRPIRGLLAWALPLGLGLGAATAQADLIITEIMFDPAGGNEHEYVEIYNNGASSVDLTGYLLTDGSRLATELSGSLAADEIAVVLRIDGSRSLANYENAWENVSNPVINFLVPNDAWPNYTNAGDSVALYASLTDLNTDIANTPVGDPPVFASAVDVVTYSAAGFPGGNDSASIYLTDLTADNSVGSNWALSAVGVDGAYQGASPRASDIGSPGILPIPEPATLALLAFSGITLLYRRPA